MIVALNSSATDGQIDQFVDWVEAKGLKTDVSKGQDVTIVGLIGDTTKIDPYLIESMDIVDHVQRVTEPFKRANRKFHPADTVIEVAGKKIGGGNFMTIAGPCSVES